MTAGALVSRADNDTGVLPAIEQRAQGAGKQYAASQAAKKDLTDETCTEYGDHDDALPEKNPLDNGCMAVNREIVNSSPAGTNPSFNPGLKQPQDPRNPYAAPQDEAKAYTTSSRKSEGLKADIWKATRKSRTRKNTASTRDIFRARTEPN